MKRCELINFGVLKFSCTPDFGTKAGLEIFLAKNSASRGGTLPQQKAQIPMFNKIHMR